VVNDWYRIGRFLLYLSGIFGKKRNGNEDPVMQKSAVLVIFDKKVKEAELLFTIAYRTVCF
jgi:hypothetical protein